MEDVLQRCAFILLCAFTAQFFQAITQGEVIYLGCFPDSRSNRSFNKFQVVDVLVTVQLCISLCARADFQIAALQSSKKCFCGDVAEQLNYVSHKSACDMPCSANTSQICGGISSNSVYKAECPVGWYGVDQKALCNMPCNCDEGKPCNHEGICDLGCPPGFSGIGCNSKIGQGCSKGSWGAHCGKSCNCLFDENCGASRGECSGPCKAGWIKVGNRCEKRCPDGKFGPECSFHCGYCRRGSTCDKVDGACLEGCENNLNNFHCINQSNHELGVYLELEPFLFDVPPSSAQGASSLAVESIAPPIRSNKVKGGSKWLKAASPSQSHLKGTALTVLPTEKGPDNLIRGDVIGNKKVSNTRVSANKTAVHVKHMVAHQKVGSSSKHKGMETDHSSLNLGNRVKPEKIQPSVYLDTDDASIFKNVINRTGSKPIQSDSHEIDDNNVVNHKNLNQKEDTFNGEQVHDGSSLTMQSNLADPERNNQDVKSLKSPHISLSESVPLENIQGSNMKQSPINAAIEQNSQFPAGLTEEEIFFDAFPKIEDSPAGLHSDIQNEPKIVPHPNMDDESLTDGPSLNSKKKLSLETNSQIGKTMTNGPQPGTKKDTDAGMSEMKSEGIIPDESYSDGKKNSDSASKVTENVVADLDSKSKKILTDGSYPVVMEKPEAESDLKSEKNVDGGSFASEKVNSEVQSKNTFYGGSYASGKVNSELKPDNRFDDGSNASEKGNSEVQAKNSFDDGSYAREKANSEVKFDLRDINVPSDDSNSGVKVGMQKKFNPTLKETWLGDSSKHKSLAKNVIINEGTSEIKESSKASYTNSNEKMGPEVYSSAKEAEGSLYQSNAFNFNVDPQISIMKTSQESVSVHPDAYESAGNPNLYIPKSKELSAEAMMYSQVSTQKNVKPQLSNFSVSEAAAGSSSDHPSREFKTNLNAEATPHHSLTVVQASDLQKTSQDAGSNKAISDTVNQNDVTNSMRVNSKTKDADDWTSSGQHASDGGGYQNIFSNSSQNFPNIAVPFDRINSVGVEGAAENQVSPKIGNSSDYSNKEKFQLTIPEWNDATKINSNQYYIAPKDQYFVSNPPLVSKVVYPKEKYRRNQLVIYPNLNGLGNSYMPMYSPYQQNIAEQIPGNERVISYAFPKGYLRPTVPINYAVGNLQGKLAAGGKLTSQNFQQIMMPVSMNQMGNGNKLNQAKFNFQSVPFGYSRTVYKTIYPTNDLAKTKELLKHSTERKIRDITTPFGWPNNLQLNAAKITSREISQGKGKQASRLRGTKTIGVQFEKPSSGQQVGTHQEEKFNFLPRKHGIYLLENLRENQLLDQNNLLIPSQFVNDEANHIVGNHNNLEEVAADDLQRKEEQTVPRHNSVANSPIKAPPFQADLQKVLNDHKEQQHLENVGELNSPDPDRASLESRQVPVKNGKDDYKSQVNQPQVQRSSIGRQHAKSKPVQHIRPVDMPDEINSNPSFMPIGQDNVAYQAAFIPAAAVLGQATEAPPMMQYGALSQYPMQQSLAYPDAVGMVQQQQPVVQPYVLPQQPLPGGAVPDQQSSMMMMSPMMMPPIVQQPYFYYPQQSPIQQPFVAQPSQTASNTTADKKGDTTIAPDSTTLMSTTSTAVPSSDHGSRQTGEIVLAKSPPGSTGWPASGQFGVGQKFQQFASQRNSLESSEDLGQPGSPLGLGELQHSQMPSQFKPPDLSGVIAGSFLKPDQMGSIEQAQNLLGQAAPMKAAGAQRLKGHDSELSFELDDIVKNIKALENIKKDIKGVMQEKKADKERDMSWENVELTFITIGATLVVILILGLICLLAYYCCKKTPDSSPPQSASALVQNDAKRSHAASSSSSSKR